MASGGLSSPIAPVSVISKASFVFSFVCNDEEQSVFSAVGFKCSAYPLVVVIVVVIFVCTYVLYKVKVCFLEIKQTKNTSCGEKAHLSRPNPTR